MKSVTVPDGRLVSRWRFFGGDSGVEQGVFGHHAGWTGTHQRPAVCGCWEIGMFASAVALYRLYFLLFSVSKMFYWLNDR